MVLPQEKRKAGMARQNGPVCVMIIVEISASMMVRTRTAIGPVCLQRLRTVDLSGKEGKGSVQLENSTHTFSIDARVSKSSCSRCEVNGRVRRRPIVHLSSSNTEFCVAPAPLHFAFPQCAIHRACAGLLGILCRIRLYSRRPVRFADRLFAAQ